MKRLVVGITTLLLVGSSLAYTFPVINTTGKSIFLFKTNIYVITLDKVLEKTKVSPHSLVRVEMEEKQALVASLDAQMEEIFRIACKWPLPPRKPLLMYIFESNAEMKEFLGTGLMSVSSVYVYAQEEEIQMMSVYWKGKPTEILSNLPVVKYIPSEKPPEITGIYLKDPLLLWENSWVLTTDDGREVLRTEPFSKWLMEPTAVKSRLTTPATWGNIKK